MSSARRTVLVIALAAVAAAVYAHSSNGTQSTTAPRRVDQPRRGDDAAGPRLAMQPGSTPNVDSPTAGQRGSKAASAIRRNPKTDAPRLAPDESVAEPDGNEAEWTAFVVVVEREFPRTAVALVRAHKDACVEISSLRSATDEDETLTDDDMFEAFIAVAQKRNDALSEKLGDEFFDRAVEKLSWPFIVACFGEEEAQQFRKVLLEFQQEEGIDLPGLPQD